MAEVEIKRDQYGRPLIPDPMTGKVRAWTRATTLASTISDRRALERWQQRNVIRGFAIRQDLVLRAVAAGEDRQQLDQVVDVALDAAQSDERAAVGTALHAVTEKIDAGEEVRVPDAFKADVEAYTAAMQKAGLRVVPGWIERFVVCPEVEAAGTPDRLFEVEGEVGLPMIGDLKTGENAVKYGMLEIAAQLAIYAHATHWWDGVELHPMPKVDQAAAIVAHMPAKSGRCELYVVDLARGWEIAKFCLEARRWRRAENLVMRMPPRVEANGAADEVASSGDEALRERVRSIVLALEGATLPVPWPVGINPPKRQEGTYSPEECERISKWCDRVAPLTTAPAH